jgi:DNA-directed RNA polymerase subunit RPC12/RpoP
MPFYTCGKCDKIFEKNNVAFIRVLDLGLDETKFVTYLCKKCADFVMNNGFKNVRIFEKDLKK